MSVSIVKASGQSEDFELRKLTDSLIRSGASADVAYDIAQKVAAHITPRMRTKHIFRMAKKLLHKYNRAADMRYSIKKAIYTLGPAGYQFEKYFARILAEYGYAVEVNRILNGYCVTHEVDIFAKRDDTGIVIECKYHSDGGIPTDVKTALYIQSRFTDIRRADEASAGAPLRIREGWLVTNTRCSADAIRFAECMGLKIVSWKYPPGESLETMIERKNLYPVTILSSIKSGFLETLFRNGFILAKDVAGIDRDAFVRKSGLDTGTALALKHEADELCHDQY